MKKYLSAACLVGTVSCISAAAEVDDTHAGQLSPMGHHGAAHGGMSSSKPFASNSSMTDMQLVTTFPPAVIVKGLAADGKTSIESRFPISTQTRVVDFKAEVLTALRVPAACRFMFKDVELMQVNVGKDGALIKLASIFNGVQGIPTIELVMDKSRSPMMTPMPEPVEGKVSPLRTDNQDASE